MEENPYQSPTISNEPRKRVRRTWAAFLDVIVAWCVVVLLIGLGLPMLDTVLSLFLPLFLPFFLLCLAGALFLTFRFIWPPRADDQTKPSPSEAEPVADPWSNEQADAGNNET